MRWSEERWHMNDDGSYVRRTGAVVSEPTYEEMTKAELVDELERLGLPKTGNKDELIARLQESELVAVED